MGAAIGVLSQLFIYSNAFDVYGEIQFILSMIAFISPLASFGLLSVVNRFFPYFEDKKSNHNGYLSILFLFAIVCFAVFLALSFLFQEYYFALIIKLGFNISAFKDYNYIIIGSIPFGILFSIMVLHSANIKRIVIPYFLSNTIWKLLLPIIILCFEFSYISQSAAYNSIFYIHLLIFALFIIYLYSQKEGFTLPKISMPLKNNYKAMVYFSFYGIITSIGSLLAFNIDKIMLRGLTNEYSTGIYSSFVMLCGLILFPYNSVISISAPLLAKAWKVNDVLEIKTMNKSICRVLLISGLILFFGMLLILDDVFKLTSNYSDFQKGMSAFIFLGLAKVIDSAFGINTLILFYSKYYYFGIIASFTLAAVNIYLNLILIPIYGLTGTAVATFVSITIYNLLFYFFNWIKFGFQSFDFSSIAIIVVLVLCYIFSSLFNFDIHPSIRILIRGSIFSFFGIVILYKLNLSPEANELVDDGFNRVRKIIKNTIR
jgi:O-antigen/teichoic acid export membrane protein